MKKSHFAIIISAVTASLLHANDSDQDMESLLNNVSTIATKKSINVDYMPSVVTVIDAETFLDAGIQNISQALDMLPGFQEQVSPMGYTISTVRGFKNPNAYFADKVKILVDGVSINNEVTGTASFYLDFPLQLVEKIEVLRGPASTMYGGGAYYGAVNIITKLGSGKKENQLYVGGGSYGAITAGTNLSITENGWNIFADGYATSNDKSLPFPEHNGDTQESVKDYSVGFKATKDNWEFLTRLKHEISGNFYSFEGKLDPLPNRPQNHSNIYLFSQLSNKTSFNDYKLETKLNYSHREENINANLFSVSSIANKFAYVGVSMQDGFYSISHISEDNYGIESTLTLPIIASNDILIGAGATYDVVTQDNYFSSVENAIQQNMGTILANSNYNSPDTWHGFAYNNTQEPAYWLNPTATTLLPKNISRTGVYAYGQDLISLTDRIDLILGLRLDNYSDFGTQLSKRAALVYRASDTTTFKLLYGSSFRNPTFTEADALGHINLRMGDAHITKPEQCDTYEAAIVYNPDFYNKFALNFYYTQLHNVIDIEEIQGTPIGYTNFPDRSSKGVEFEYFYKSGVTHNLYFNASYVDATYNTSPDGNTVASAEVSVRQSMPDISKVMLKAIYVYTPTPKLSFGTAWRYFSETTASEIPWVASDVAAEEYSASVKSASIFDETLTYRISASSELRATIKNIFNERVMQPAYYYFTADAGIQREGRNYMFTFTQKF